MSHHIKFLFIIAFTFKLTEGNIFLWSNKQFQIPTLKYFDDSDFLALKQKLISPNVIAFKGNLSQLSSASNRLFAEKYTAYVPNGHIDIDSIIGKRS